MFKYKIRKFHAVENIEPGKPKRSYRKSKLVSIHQYRGSSKVEFLHFRKYRLAREIIISTELKVINFRRIKLKGHKFRDFCWTILKSDFIPCMTWDWPKMETPKSRLLPARSSQTWNCAFTWPQNHMISIILYCDKKFTKISKPWKIFDSNHKIV